MLRSLLCAVLYLASVQQHAWAAGANGAGFGMMACSEALPLLNQPQTRLAFAS